MKKRIVFLDWLRGLAALVMLQGHTFHAFLRPEERDSAPFYLSIFLGGQAAAIFLFLTGVTLGLGMHRRESLPRVRRVLASLRRAGYLFLLAVLFRLQTWLFSLPRSHTYDLLKVDVLNLMGVTAAILAGLSVFNGLRRARYATVVGVAFAVLAPVMIDTPAGLLPTPLRNYLVPSGDGFSMFPWGAFLAFGCAVGSVVPLIATEQWDRVMQWVALCGLGMLVTAQYFGALPYSIYPHADYWINSPALIFGKLSVTLLLGAVAYLWTTYFDHGPSWVVLLGTTSLPVYWVHIEIEYGRWFADYQQRLTSSQCSFWALVMIASMVAMSWGIRRVREWRRGSVAPAHG